jgi:2-phospho-L-lactate guanylyltransferase
MTDDTGGGALLLGRVAVLVPVKAFADAKVRLAPALDADERSALARSMAGQVVAAARRLPVAVVCDDREVAGWARDLGVLVVWEPGRGLNGAVEAGVAQLARLGVEQVIVAHADLPLATDLTWVADFDGVTLVPDRASDGTNVACVPTAAGFRFAYGPGSFARHQAEARRLGLALRVVHEPSLSWDIDVPADLTTLQP